jgi:hypothetical protein
VSQIRFDSQLDFGLVHVVLLDSEEAAGTSDPP